MHIHIALGAFKSLSSIKELPLCMGIIAAQNCLPFIGSMARQKKKGSQDKTLKILILATAILNLIESLVDLIDRLLE